MRRKKVILISDENISKLRINPIWKYAKSPITSINAIKTNTIEIEIAIATHEDLKEGFSGSAISFRLSTLMGSGVKK